MFRSRSCRLFQLLVLTVLIGGMSVGCSRKPRKHFWEFWRAKESPRIEIVPDDVILPPDLAELDRIGGSGQAIPYDFGNDDPGLVSGGDAGVTPIGIASEPPVREKPLGVAADLAMINFGYDSAGLSAGAQAILEEHAKWLLETHPTVEIQIQGHCDERGTSEYNLSLGQRRADAVREYLVAKGVQNNRLHTISYGEERPLDTAGADAAFAKNRRAQFLVYATE